MTELELEELLDDCPILYHMAAGGSWPSIQQRGLLSTTALIDLYGVSGVERHQIESQRRPASVVLSDKALGRVVIRDQLPMDDKGLSRCLRDGLTPARWYGLLNSKVFFWLTAERLAKLLNAGAYRTGEHDVLEIAARPLVESYTEKIWLCPMNSGCTKPYPHPRGKDTFRRISDYPYSAWKQKRRRGERVVELAVEHGVPDVAKFVTRVSRMKGDETLRVLFAR